MAIAHRASAGFGTTNPTTSATVVLSAAIAAGDDLFVLFTSRDHLAATALATCTDNDTGGNLWQLIACSADRKANIYWKKATSATASKTVTVAGAVGSLSGGYMSFSGCDAGYPVRGLSVEANISGNENHASIDRDYANMFTLLGIFNYGNDNAVTAPDVTADGSMTTGFEKLSTGGSDSACHGAWVQSNNTAGEATGLITWNQLTDGVTYSALWALKPAITDEPEFYIKAFGTDTTAHAVPMPLTVDAGDLLLALINVSKDQAITTPSGWTAERTYNVSDFRVAVFSKDASGSEDGTTVDFVTAAVSTMVAIVIRIPVAAWGGDPATCLEVSTVASGSSAVPDPPSLNPAQWAAEATIWLALVGIDNVAGTSPPDVTFPTGYTDGIAMRSNMVDPPSRGMAMVAMKRSSASSEDPGVFTLTGASQPWGAFTVAVRVAVGGTTFTQALTATALSGIATAQKQTTKSLSASSGKSAIAQKQAAKTLSTSSGSSATAQKQATKTLSASAAAGASMVITVVRPRALTASAVVAVATVQRQAAKPLTTSRAATATVQRQVATTKTTTPLVTTATAQRQVNKSLANGGLVLLATLSRAITRLQALTGTVTTNASVQRQTTKTLSASRPTSATMQRLIMKNLTATVGRAASLAFLIVKTVALSATVGTQATLQRQTNKTLASAPLVMAASQQHLVTKTLSTSSGKSATLASLLVKLLALTTSRSTSATMQRQTSKQMTATSGTSATLTRILTLLRTLTATVGKVATMQRQTNKTVTATPNTTTATLSRLLLKLVALVASVGKSATMQRFITKPLVTSNPANASVQKQSTKSLNATVGKTATLTKAVTFLRTLIATVGKSATMQRQTSKSLSASNTTSASAQRLTFKSIAASVASSATLTKIRTAQVNLFAAVGTLAEVVLQVIPFGSLLPIVPGITFKVGTNLALSFARATEMVMTMGVRTGLALSNNVVTGAAVSFAKRIAASIKTGRR